MLLFFPSFSRFSHASQSLMLVFKDQLRHTISIFPSFSRFSHASQSLMLVFKDQLRHTISAHSFTARSPAFRSHFAPFLHCGHLVGCGMSRVVWWGGTLGPNTGLRVLLQRTTQNDLLNYKGVKVAYVYLSMLLVNVYIFERDWVRKRRNMTESVFQQNRYKLACWTR